MNMDANGQAKKFLEKYNMTKCPTFMGIKVDESWEKEDLLMLINYLGEETHFRHAGWAVAGQLKRRGIRTGV